MKITVTVSKKESKDYNSNGVSYTLEREYQDSYDPNKAFSEVEAICQRQLSQGTSPAQAKPVQQGQGNNGQVNTAPKQAYARPSTPPPQNTQAVGRDPLKQYNKLLATAINRKDGTDKALYAELRSRGIFRNKEKTFTNLTQEQFDDLLQWLGV